MSGRLGNYLDLVRKAQKKRMQITRDQEKEIRSLYKEIATEMESSLKRHSSKTLTHRWLRDYSKALRRGSKSLYQSIEQKVSSSILQTAGAVAEAEQHFYAKACPCLSERFSDVFSTIPQEMVEELMNGGIYKGFAGLSERLWDYEKQFSRDIQTIINRGILAQKPAFDLAKDLEMYVKPGTRKPWNWGTVYPGVHRQVDYNAQRLARTAVTHAYQLSFQRATQDNPFVEAYSWHSSNGGRVCDLCKERDGQLFEKDSLPLDHPNGMCVITAEIPKSLKEIGEELGDWAAGRSNNPALDLWLNPRPQMEDVNLKPLPITSKSVSAVKRFPCELLSPVLQAKLQNEHKKLLISISGKPLGTEAGATYDLSMRAISKVIGEDKVAKVKIPKESVPYIAIHSHPSGVTFTHTDLMIFARDDNMKMLTAIGNNGCIYAVEKKDSFSALEFQRCWEQTKEKHNNYKDNPDEYITCILNFLKEADRYGMRYYTTGT